MNHNMLIKKRKGQAAIEFLVTYGWAIMAAMLVIGALTYFGITNPATSLPDKCIFSNGFECKDFIIKPTEVKLTLVNTAGQTIYGTPVDITASLTDSGTVCTTTMNGGAITDIASMEPEAQMEVICAIPADSFNINEKAKSKVTITYRKIPSGYNQLSLGEVYAVVQAP